MRSRAAARAERRAARSLAAAALLAAAAGTGATDAVRSGRELAFARDKGNCLACHVIAGGEQAGTVGPPLLDMRARWPDPDALAARIADSTALNPATLMPPFGRHRILSAEEIAAIVAFLYTL